MNLLIVSVLIQFVQSSHYKEFSHSALSLVCICRSSDTSSFDIDHTLAHERVYELRSRDKASGLLSLRHTFSIVEKEYVGYLRRIREKTLGQANVGKLVEKVTKRNAWAYYTRAKSEKVTLRIRNMSHAPGVYVGGDFIQQEYLKNSNAAMETYFFTMYDYQPFIKLPSIDTKRSARTMKEYIAENLADVKEYINVKLTKFDYGTTYPDAVKCLSLLQNLNYVALLSSNFKLVKNVSELLKAAMAALENMDFSPIRSWSMERVSVCLMPHEPNGHRNVIPISVYENNESTVIRISSQDVRDPDDFQEVGSLLKSRNVVPTNYNSVR